MVGQSGGQRLSGARVSILAAIVALALGASLAMSTSAHAATNPRVSGRVSSPTPPIAVAVDSKTDAAFVIAGNALLSAIDERDHSVTASRPLGFSGAHIAVDPKRGLIFVEGFYAPTPGQCPYNAPPQCFQPAAQMRVYSEVSLSQVNNLDLACTQPGPQAPGGWNIAEDPHTGTVYLPCVGGLEEVNEAGMKNVVMNVPGTVQSVSVDQDTGTLYATVNAPGSTNSSVTVIDERTGMLTATIPIGKRADGIAVAPKRAKVYVAHDGNAVSVIDERSNKVTKTVAGLSGAVGVATDPNSKSVFVTDGLHTVSVIDGYNDHLTKTLGTGMPLPSNYEEPSPSASADLVAVDNATGAAFVVDGDVPWTGPSHLNQFVSVIKSR